MPKHRSQTSQDRMVIISAETILELFKDYLGEEEVPSDAKLVGFPQFHPAMKGKLSIVAQSAHFKPSDPPEREVHFALKRVFGGFGGTPKLNGAPSR